ncbi:transcription elongation factor SPT6-like [Microplitis mediator]|uniref:transcription elongation factor SPT6-like n=1 Tax=Microplitis mediator TaxID=375433 RepID=UPI002556605D|nr:transcription elongation factor SPT6-like [Microplitis mediator]
MNCLKNNGEHEELVNIRRKFKNCVVESDDDGTSSSESEESERDDDDDEVHGSKRKKSHNDDDEFDDRLEDDDYDLIEENLGITVDRRRFKRLKQMPAGGSDDEDETGRTEKESIADELFENGMEDDTQKPSHESEHEGSYLGEDDESVSSEDDFIVGDDDKPIAKKKYISVGDPALDEAREIFGVEFNYDDDMHLGDKDVEAEDDRGITIKSTGHNICEIYEPVDLKRAFFTSRDHEIRCEDVPERMQLRSTPITPVPKGSSELDQEAEWIYKRAFTQKNILRQVRDSSNGMATFGSVKGPKTVEKIKNALDLMRNQKFEVPFIAFYRKELVEPELNVNDLWKVYKFDAKWCEFRQRKEKLLSLVENMRDFQLGELMKNPDAPLSDQVRVIKDQDIEQLKNVETNEERNDFYNLFMLYYSRDIPQMKEILRRKEMEARESEKIRKRQQHLLETEENSEDPPLEDEDAEESEKNDHTLKQAVRSGPYTLYVCAGLSSFAKKFGLTPEQFAENLQDNYQRHEIVQDPVHPDEVAREFLGESFQSTEQVLQAVQHMVAIQLAREPIVRKCAREMYMDRAKLSVRPTKKGIKEIDESHPIHTMKYLKDKPVRELVDQMWLKLSTAEADGLITISFSETVESIIGSDFISDSKQLYIKDEFNRNAQDWNNLRSGSVEMAFKKYIIPDLKNELRANITAEAKESITYLCCRRLFNWIKFAPYTCEFYGLDDEAWNTGEGIRSMGIAYVPDINKAAFASIVAPNGECVDFLKLPHLLKRKNSFNKKERLLKEADLISLRNFISKNKPHIVVIGGESRDAQTIYNDIRECLKTLSKEDQYPAIRIEICDSNVAKIFSTSNTGVAEFPEFPPLLRESISLARRLQNPLGEFSQLCNPDEDLLCLKFHPLQDLLSKEELLVDLYAEFINRVNEIGVDLSSNNIYNKNLLQFVCGLGPRKSKELLKILKCKKIKLENRTQLVTMCHMGPKVFINCGGFIKIDTATLDDNSDVYIEVLDSTRIHPESYEWARKMAVDALDYENQNSDLGTAIEETIKTPEKLQDLDLEAFAAELERQGFGNKIMTLYDVTAELTDRYKDPRVPYVSPSPKEIFTLLTKETQETFYVGKLVQATVIGFNFKKPEGKQLDHAKPVKNNDTGLWQCPFCSKDDFSQLAEVWNHFDTGNCPGKAVGVRLRLDNGLPGYIHTKNISDRHVANPQDRVHIQQVITCRVTKVDVDRFDSECSSKSSDLSDVNNIWRPAKDSYYDTEAEEEDRRAEKESRSSSKQPTYTRRLIDHSSFHNISFAEAEKLMKTMNQGEAITRPSSKGADHLTLTWKVTDDVYQHIDIIETDKPDSVSLGRSLSIGTEQYEDLDEIIARLINMMAGNVADILKFKYYRREVLGFKDKAEEILKEQKIINPRNIPYLISPSKNYPGKFLLSYVPESRCYHEYVSVTSEGFKFREEKFNNFTSLICWFKNHFRDLNVVSHRSFRTTTYNHTAEVNCLAA